MHSLFTGCREGSLTTYLANIMSCGGQSVEKSVLYLSQAILVPIHRPRRYGSFGSLGRKSKPRTWWARDCRHFSSDCESDLKNETKERSKGSPSPTVQIRICWKSRKISTISIVVKNTNKTS